jgi:hypothetical protein
VVCLGDLGLVLSAVDEVRLGSLINLSALKIDSNRAFPFGPSNLKAKKGRKKEE